MIIHLLFRDLVSDLMHSPRDDIAVTTSKCGEFKVWMRHRCQGSVQSTDDIIWICRSVAHYRGEMLGKCAFSGDGSLLAVTAASSVTMWDPQLNTMVGQLSVPTAKASSKAGTLQFSHLKFVAKSVFLVGCCKNPTPSLVVWNITTMSVWWSVPVPCLSLTTDPLSDRFAVLLPHLHRFDGQKSKAKYHCDGLAITFNVNSPRPERLWTVPKGPTACIHFLPLQNASHDNKRPLLKRRKVSMERSLLLLVLENRQYGIVGDAGDETLSKIDDSQSLIESADNELSPFVTAFGHKQSSSDVDDETTFNTENANLAHSQHQQEEDWSRLVDVMSHKLPHMTRLCQDFLKIVVGMRTSIN